ncbi:hypothetical protein FQN60_011639 [Etheostoma spectabile]|uniref:VWFA domain-containing protein n=1 Tax=Etheostoma spectabile TaxID=54343 RepID=A0A5J5DM98_9PERO|nr:hypothetical protein FQN60_011639 [Etheostoma spectabile]
MGKMHGQRHIFLLTFMVAVAIPVSLAFNIDITNPDVYTGEQKDFFGYKVLQFMNGMNKGFCEKQQHFVVYNTEWYTKIPVKHLGLSIAEDSKRSQFTVCSPSVVRECYGNSYMNSVCYNITDHLEPISNFTSAFQECEKKTVDLVFLFDGSASMGEGDFKKNKDFIVDIIQELLKNSSIKFAAVQFSSDYRKVFDFNEYQRGEYLTKLEKEGHMNTLTNTHKALTFVFKEIFKNPDAGASADATKVLVGNMANLTKFKGIASEPIGKYAFKIDNYDGLTGILINFQKKIFTMEGSKVARAGEMTNEMSQSGFSAVFYKDNLILGSVGSNSWRGSLQELNGEKETQIEDPDMPMDSYMGYSTAVGEKDHAPLYFTGAPRFEHIGQVVLFTHDGTNWTTTQRINGEQVDVNSDGNTDFLLVGAPLFYQPQEKKEGQIHIYTLTDEMKLESKLTVTAPSMGRFGTTISSLADLNGDGLRDVAVGAPLQDFNRGAVYIYLGDRHRGIRSTFSQRIMGEKIKPGLRFFGQSIAGNIDLGKDGLPDIVVGSQGTAVVLRSRPIFNITTRLSFEPNEISTEKIDCLDNTDANLPMVTLQACFEIAETTKSKAAAMDLGLNISYTLEVDANRQTNRGFFSQTAKKARNLTSTYELRDPDTCFNYTIYMPKCVKDTLLPIIIKLNFSQVDSESASAVLNMDSKTQAVVQVPFEKQCRKNDICIAELEVDFNFMTPTLLVAENKYFNVSVTLSNYGDDSYYTSLIMHYPPGLSFSRMTLTKATRPTLHSCEDLHGEREKTICNVSPPVFRSKSSATFRISFHILKDYEWNDTMLMTITGKSDNANRTISQTKNIPVQFEIKMAVAVKEDLVTYLNFTPEDAGPKQMVAIYKIDNLGFKDFPVNVSLFFPTKLEHNFEMTNYQVFVQQNKTQCTGVTIMTSDYCLPEKNCKFIVCDSFTLKRESPIEITLSGDVHFKDLKKHAMTEVRVEFTIPPDKVVIIATGVAMGLLLLLIITVIMFKLGCFKRKTLEYCEGQEEETAPQDGIPAKSTTGTTVGICSHSETDSKSDQPSEHQSLLDDGEANCSTSSVQSKEELE